MVTPGERGALNSFPSRNLAPGPEKSHFCEASKTFSIPRAKESFFKKVSRVRSSNPGGDSIQPIKTIFQTAIDFVGITPRGVHKLVTPLGITPSKNW